MENNLRKCDEDDATILAKMPKTCFKKLTVRGVKAEGWWLDHGSAVDP
jgi:hypothetical protein